MTQSIQVRIKRHSPEPPYSFHNAIVGRVFDARLLENGIYLVDLGIHHSGSGNVNKTEWAFTKEELELV